MLVVDAVHDRYYRDDFHSGFVQIVYCLQFHVEQVADFAVRVGGVADAVELQIRIAHSGFGGLLGEFQTLREFDSVGCGLHAVVSHFAGVAHGIQEIRRQRRLAARELHRHLTPRLDRDRVVEHRLDVFPAQFVDEADLVRVHEAGIAHHVAAVGEVDGQHRTASVLHRGRPVVMQLLVVVGANVAARETLLRDARKIRCQWTSRLRSGREWDSLSPSKSCRRAPRSAL